MWCNQIFSIVNPTVIQIDLETSEVKYIVENVIVCDNYNIANQIAKLHYSNEAYAVDTTQLPVTIGCEHKNGFFYDKDGNMLELVKSQEQIQIEDLIIVIADMLGGAN